MRGRDLPIKREVSLKIGAPLWQPFAMTPDKEQQTRAPPISPQDNQKTRICHKRHCQFVFKQLATPL